MQFTYKNTKIASTERDFKICKEMQKRKKSKTHEKVKQLSVREHNTEMTTVNFKKCKKKKIYIGHLNMQKLWN